MLLFFTKRRVWRSLVICTSKRLLKQFAYIWFNSNRYFVSKLSVTQTDSFLFQHRDKRGIILCYGWMHILCVDVALHYNHLLQQIYHLHSYHCVKALLRHLNPSSMHDVCYINLV